MLEIKGSQILQKELADFVDSIIGTYFDSISGLKNNLQEMIKNQEATIEEFKTSHPDLANMEYMDSTFMIYGKGNPNEPDSEALHKSTQKDYKKRNSVGGANFKFIGNMCIVYIYQFWEDYFRAKIADLLNAKLENVKSDLMGDLRLIRHSILHNHAIAQPEIERCVVLKWFRAGDQVYVNEDMMEELLRHLKKFTIRKES